MAPTSAEHNEMKMLLAYAADLELEVDRLRRQGAFIERNSVETLMRILRLCTGGQADAALPTLIEVKGAAERLIDLVKDLHESPGYHPAHDQVVAIAVRPLLEQVFRWQRRLTGQGSVQLQLELQSEHMEWFPARFRHIIDNLFAAALNGVSSTTSSERVLGFSLRADPGGYLLHLIHDGIHAHHPLFDSFPLAAPFRPKGAGGLAVVRLLVEQSGGTITLAQQDDRQTKFIIQLPRYDLLDYLE